ncbi:MAG: tRNA 2-thiouridine(34) synthase MnmA [Candidatus Kapabacteria bacterium]|nr:tRNA 2-thiouridine(34) synthase MnmA [Candidatus Kapabacteria bacterium]
MLDKNKVLVGMSGGVDSSVAASILKKNGYDVLGITITSIKSDDSCRPDSNESGCCGYSAVIDAGNVCDILQIPHKLVDLTEIFKEEIIDNFINEYLSGRTPNPCTICNPLIKWGEVLKKADQYGCYYYATGHYANIKFNPETSRYFVSKGKDNLKDQSYFLWGLKQEHLERTIFPLGDLIKPEVRKLAQEFKLPVFNKIESQEICFVTNNDYQDFLKKAVPELDSKFNGGDIVFDGMVVGKHKGYPFYTIGQRKGLGISYHKPLFVKKIIPETNTIEVATEEDIFNRGLIAKNVNLMKYSDLDGTKIFNIKVRYRDKGSDGFCKIDDNGNLVVEFVSPKKSITPGQSVVVYEGDDLVAGGVIDTVIN